MKTCLVFLALFLYQTVSGVNIIKNNDFNMSAEILRTDSVNLEKNNTLTEAWVARYDGSGNLNDEPTAMAVDQAGNIYVTGIGTYPGTGQEYTTIKYNTDGLEQWVARYTPHGDYLLNEATAIAVDKEGNVYVTGHSFGSGTGNDYATIKYNSDGVEQWVARYNGSGNGYDGARAIAVSDSGNVYVTGESKLTETEEDYLTIKYSASGEEKWVARYDGSGHKSDNAYAIAVDTSGNVYVTGGSTNDIFDSDMITIKYNAAGVLQWEERYKQSYAEDAARAAVLDESGNFFVTGLSFDTYSDRDYATIKYNTNGQKLWDPHYNGPANDIDEAGAIAVSDSGNIYVTGRSYGIETYYDFATIKYNASGEEQWVMRYNGPGNVSDEAKDITVDKSGNVYVTGPSLGSGTGYDYATICYDASGKEKYMARYNGPGTGHDNPVAIAIDGSGNIYVTGSSLGNELKYDYATIKYNSILVSVEDYNLKPDVIGLKQNYPNPFRISTTIPYEITKKSKVVLKILNSLGIEVAILVDEIKQPGQYEVIFNADGMSEGVYFYNLQTDIFTTTKRLIILK